MKEEDLVVVDTISPHLEVIEVLARINNVSAAKRDLIIIINNIIMLRRLWF